MKWNNKCQYTPASLREKSYEENCTRYACPPIQRAVRMRGIKAWKRIDSGAAVCSETNVWTLPFPWKCGKGYATEIVII